MKNEFGRLWAEAVVACSRQYLSIYLDSLWKITNNLIHDTVNENLICDLPNTNRCWI
jgi:hypothetical protein